MSSIFFTLLQFSSHCYYLMMSECSYSWCVVSVFVTSRCCLCLSINTFSVLRYDSFLCYCIIRVPLWYGPWVWRKYKNCLL